MLDKNNQYIIEDYQKKSLFYSFLPGIGGEHGIPMWCYYLNRGQAIACFGVQDKDHSILEFYPAHQAVQRTPLLGFRTFLKYQGKVKELFSCGGDAQTMTIGMNSLKISDFWKEEEIRVQVEYETLPEEPVAALMRKVILTNESTEEKALEILDGLTELVPYGVTSSSMKDMGQTSKAWMQTYNLENKVPCFRVRASMEDSARVEAITGSVFGMAREQKELLDPIVDKTVIFRQDAAYVYPYGFAADDADTLGKLPQIICNDAPCCYFLKKRTLKPGESISLLELYGMTEDTAILDTLVSDFMTDGWFEGKEARSVELTDEITEAIAGETGDQVFDAYSRQTFLDNVLRGGYPKKIGDELLYLYSRKHGDMERDYNYFSMAPEFYSQGNGNFRDVNQNRRCDVLFYPYVGDKNLKRFYNALQLNGYNPLGVEKITFITPDGEEKTPGQLYKDLAQEKGGLPTDEEFAACMGSCKKKEGYDYIEGHWSDHWTYNLDLLESYLAVYPEKEDETLFEDRSYTYRQAEMRLLPRRQRYEETEGGIRQYHFLRKNEKCEKDTPLKDKDGKVIESTLAEKLITLVAVKMAALDPYGMGVEMEGGKPGWYDALNGLPGLLGSSMAEAYELARVVEYTLDKLAGKSVKLQILTEVDELIQAISKNGEAYEKEESSVPSFNFWQKVNDAKELFWDRTTEEVQGSTASWDEKKAVAFLEQCRRILAIGRERSKSLSEIPATYYYYEVTAYQKDENGILPTSFAVHKTPDFLEGAVHTLKLRDEAENRSEIYDKVRHSHLYDEKLHMYKINSSLSEASFELGRSCAFTPGWLENESVWLHMEYKYFLELLKAGMYEEFAEDWHKGGVPFLDETVYGRSVLENSSFLASSVNPNPAYHGKGFVARLSGSTAEFLEIWQIMMFGKRPFVFEDGVLKLNFQPFLPDYLIGERKTVTARFVGTTDVIYELPDDRAVVPGGYEVISYEITWKNGTVSTYTAVTGPEAEAVRDGQAMNVRVKIGR